MCIRDRFLKCRGFAFVYQIWRAAAKKQIGFNHPSSSTGITSKISEVECGPSFDEFWHESSFYVITARLIFLDLMVGDPLAEVATCYMK